MAERSLNEIPLSVLDLAPIVEGASVAEALQNSLVLARHVEQLGYGRHWVAEHHSLVGVASSATAVLMAHIADATSTIRVGAGGIMLPNHSPLVIAEQFGTLEALHPGRIDLGLGRAPGSDPVTARALRRTTAQSGDDMPELLAELVAFFTGGFPPDHPFHSITAVPGLGLMPPLWLLGSSGYSAQLAGILGLRFAFAHHFSASNTVQALEIYRRSFRPSEALATPFAMVAVMTICADTEDAARRLAASDGLSFLRRRLGRHGQLPSIESALDYPYSDADRVMIDERHASQAVGDPKMLKRRLEVLAAETGADELMLATLTFAQSDRLHSYELVAEIAGLGSPTPS